MSVTSKLTSELKKFIKSSNHIESGRLYKTARVIQTKDGFAISANEYILYLDDGQFVTNFFNQPKVQQLITEYLTSQIEKDLEI